jgi:hypothetical protein
MTFTESTIEQAALDWLDSLKYQLAFGPDLAFDGSAPERQNYQDVVLVGRLQEALHRPNPSLPPARRTFFPTQTAAGRLPGGGSRRVTCQVNPPDYRATLPAVKHSFVGDSAISPTMKEQLL